MATHEHTFVHSLYMQGWPELYTYTVCIRYFWQGNHQIYGHTRCNYTDLANPMYKQYAHKGQLSVTVRSNAITW
jgi:hypothetical protein